MYTYRASIVRVVDGDTFDAEVDLGFYMVARIRFRLAGVDTPEVRGVERPEGLKASAFVKDAIEGETVIVRTAKAGKFGRWLASVEYEGEDTEVHDLATVLLREGLAEPYHGGRR
jgi:micrococcal nuclease